MAARHRRRRGRARKCLPANTGTGAHSGGSGNKRTYVVRRMARMVHSAVNSNRVRVGIVGVGNCASSFIQGLTHYRDVRSNEPAPGLMNARVGNYHVSAIEIASAFDINAHKVGKDVAAAMWAEPNNTFRFADVRPLGVPVHRGPTLDGLGQYLRDDIIESDESEVDVADVLDRTRTDVLVSYLPVGSQKA